MIMILATIMISILSYYRDISNYRHYRPALIMYTLLYVTGFAKTDQIVTTVEIQFNV